jgi:MOSC domain-containing protein YiiM
MDLRTAVSRLLEAEAREPLEDWLAQRGMGLVGVADPAGFGWPGRYLARWGEEWSVLFAMPPGVLDGRGGDGPPEEIRLVVPHEVVLPLSAEERRQRGTVELVAIAEHAGAPLRAVPEARALAGAGLEGDRYVRGAGTFSDDRSGRALTLIEAEALEAAGVDALEARRNVVVRGVRVDALRGRRFRIGTAECLGQRRCEPCAHLQRLTRPGMLRALVHRGGLRADVLRDGVIRAGDAIEVLDEGSVLPDR